MGLFDNNNGSFFGVMPKTRWVILEGNLISRE